MTQSFARSAGRCLVLLAVAFSVDACMATQHVALDRQTDLNRASGITTQSGRTIAFTRAGASIVNDTLYAAVSTGQLIMPTDSVATVSRKKFSTPRTLGLVGGVMTGVMLIALIGVAASGLNISP